MPRFAANLSFLFTVRPFLPDHLERPGHAGWAGCGYRPGERSEDSFGWLEAWR